MSRRLYKSVIFFLVIILLPALITLYMSEGGGVTERKSASEEYYIISKQERIPLEEYLTGAVAFYMPVSCDDEAFKAMAVLLRTFVLFQMGDLKEIEEEKLSLSRYQMEEMEVMFGDKFSYTYSRYQTAVQITKGETLKYEGELIEPYFHQVSAGMTNSLAGIPYLSSVDSPYDIQADRYLSLITISSSEFCTGLWKAADSSEELLMQEVSAEDIMAQIIVEVREGEYKQSVVWKNIRIPAVSIQKVFGLPSTAFQFEAYEGNIRIITKGLGHGIGLSLHGAMKMAEEGKSYREILTYYYSNITVSGE